MGRCRMFSHKYYIFMLRIDDLPIGANDKTGIKVAAWKVWDPRLVLSYEIDVVLLGFFSKHAGFISRNINDTVPCILSLI